MLEKLSPPKPSILSNIFLFIGTIAVTIVVSFVVFNNIQNKRTTAHKIRKTQTPANIPITPRMPTANMGFSQAGAFQAMNMQKMAYPPQTFQKMQPFHSRPSPKRDSSFKQLRTYIVYYSKQGYSPDQIKQALFRQNWPLQTIDEAFRSLRR